MTLLDNRANPKPLLVLLTVFLGGSAFSESQEWIPVTNAMVSSPNPKPRVLLKCTNIQEWTCYTDSSSNMCELVCQKRSLTNLNLGGLGKLQGLWCGDNSLTTLNLKPCPNLKSLYCWNNQLTTLDLSGFADLDTLHCWNNRLTKLDLNRCVTLSNLMCDANQLENLDLSGHTNLYFLVCSGNRLTNLNVTGCTSLHTLVCAGNRLTGVLDLSTCTNLAGVNALNNSLTEIKLWDKNQLPARYFYHDRGVSITDGH